MKLAIALVLVLGCGKSSNRVGDDEGSAGQERKKKAPPAKVAASPECLAKTKAFGPWYAALMLEKRSYELDFGEVLLPTDRKPSPVSHEIDAAEINKSGGIGIWDASEANHVGSPVGDKPDDKKLLEVLKKDRATLSPPTGIDHGDDDTIRIDVDQAAPWLSVVRVAKAAREAGYAKAVFVVTAKPVAEQPPGVDVKTTSAEVTKAADKLLEQMMDKCPPFSRASMHLPGDKLTPEQDAAAWGEATAAAFAECNCAVDPDEVKKAEWQATKWVQATPRAGVTVLLADGKTLSQASTVPWSEAAKVLLEAAPEGQPPTAVSFELAKR